MPQITCHDVIAAYECDGAVCLREVYSKQVAAQIKAKVVSLYDEFIKQATYKFYDCLPETKCGFMKDGSPYLFYGPNAVAMSRQGTVSFSLLSRDIPAFTQLYGLPRLAQQVGSIIRASCVRHWQDEFFVKNPAHDNPTPWHQDASAWPFKGDMVPTLWIALTDVTPDGGALKTIRGSHRYFVDSYPPPRNANEDLEYGYSNAPDFDALVARQKVQVQTWELNAGDAILFHPKTIHGASKNDSTIQRIALSLRWLGDGVIYKPDKYSVNEPLLGDVPAERRDASKLFPICWAR